MQRDLVVYGWRHREKEGEAVEDVEGCRKEPPTYELPFPLLYLLHQICEAHNDLLSFG